MFIKYALVLLICSFVISCNTKKTTEKKPNDVLKTENVVKGKLLNDRYSFIVRKENQNINSFVENVQKKIYGNKIYSLNHTIIETDKWMDGLSAIIIFFNVAKEDEYESYTDVEGYLLSSKDKVNYNKMKIDTYFPAGNQAIVKSVLFVNVDGDKQQELGVICTWKQTLKNTAEGTLYETRFYDDIKEGNNSQLVLMKEISDHFGFEFEGYKENENFTAKFKNVESIKNELDKMNFKSDRK